MIKQRFKLSRYDWSITVFYAVHDYFVDDILDELKEIGIRGENLIRARENLTSGKLNTGLSFVNKGRAVCVIGLASNAEQYADSIQHEVMHLALFIGKAEGLPLDGEEVCYIGGEIARKMWKKTKMLTSECGCYTERIERKL